MTSIIPLGTFRRVGLREAWPTEDGNFTPWLAKAENMQLLGEALNMELELEAMEHWVGAFKADILARNLDDDDHRVIIENQFGRTNHGHLGQILTYMAGVENVKTVIWIAENIQADHRAAIDWLNENTIDGFSFFAVEMELWRIGNSLPAPRFNIIASPNDWTRVIRGATNEGLGREAAWTARVRLAYWTSFCDYLHQHGQPARRPSAQMWYSFSIGRSGFHLNTTISTEKNRVGVELYIRDDADKVAFHELFDEKDEIEREFGEPLEWQELPGKQATRIAIYKYNVDPSDPAQFPEIHAWMFDKMKRFREVFAHRVKNLAVRDAA